ncbi:hypothetical protein [Streptomyces phaeofaciens]|uniref:hypothetical protein n=1 Tax=Streptomyces phaeofaciens TaxID=68254 RepID=UPI0036A15E13
MTRGLLPVPIQKSTRRGVVGSRTIHCGFPPAPGAVAWHQALGPLPPDQRRMFIDTLRAHEAAMAEGHDT